MTFRPRHSRVILMSEANSVPLNGNIRLTEGNLDSADHVDTDQVDMNHVDAGHVDKNHVVDIRINNESKKNILQQKGLSVTQTLFFLLGDVAGAGVLAMPKALHDVGGYPGILLVIFSALINGYTALVLGRCWVMLQKKHPEYAGGCRYPYQALGFQAAGKTGRIVVSFCLNVSQFGTGTVFLILAAENLRTLCCHIGNAGLSHCYWILIVAGLMCPILWLGTPKDFWQIAVGAALATVVVVILVLVQAGLDFSHKSPNVSASNESHVKFGPFFLATGTMAFAFGGHASFPTIQDDMKQPERFGRAALWGYSAILTLYLPVTIMGYVAYGDALQSNVIENMPSGGIQYSALILITLHLYCASTIVWNAVFQEAEELLNVPKTFGWKRAVLRTILLGLATFLAVSVPTFGVLMDLIGSSTFAILSLVCPGLFYLILANRFRKETSSNKISMEKEDLEIEEIFRVSLWEKIVIILIMLLGLFAAGSGTYVGIAALVKPKAFSLPCYMTHINNTCSK